MINKLTIYTLLLMSFYLVSCSGESDKNGKESSKTEEKKEEKKEGTFTDERDGKVYKTIRINGMTWMAENFAYKPKDGKYWAYMDNEAFAMMHGYLYDWETAKKVAPKGWRLPTDDEVRKLINVMGDAYSVLGPGGYMKFNAKLSGVYEEGHKKKWRFYGLDEKVIYWSMPTPYSQDPTVLIFKRNHSPGVNLAYMQTREKESGLSVRYIKGK